MRVYRITLEPYSHRLYASGLVARWNSKGTFVIYTASTRSLACLENVVHRGGEGLARAFRTMIIDIPDKLQLTRISIDELPSDWKEFKNQPQTRAVGDAWSRRAETAVLKIPSAIIPEEYNYLINPNHPEFSSISLIRTDRFEFDRRFF